LYRYIDTIEEEDVVGLGMLELVVVGTLLIGLGLVVRDAWFGQGRWNPAVWAEHMHLELTPLNEPMVRTYLVRTRLLRFAGALLGVLAPRIYQSFFGGPLPVPLDFGLFDALLGYLLGAVIAELTIKRPSAHEPRASLMPRELRDYVPTGVITAFRSSALVALVLVPLYRLLPARQRLVDLNDVPPEIVLLPTILVIGLGVELLQRYIVARSQPAVESDLIDADDAIRSASVHALAGAGIALELLIVSGQLINLAVVSELELLRWAFPALALLSFGIAIGSWVYVTKPVRRGRWLARAATHP
jgi:hypothetical protein